MRANAARARRPAPSRSAPASGWTNLIPVELEPAEGGAAGAAAVVAGEKGDDQRGARFFTHRECARLMGFAERFRVLREEDARGPASALFGTAVCPPIVAAVAACMLAAREDPAEEPATKRRRRECVAEDDVETIGAWTGPGARAALRLALRGSAAASDRSQLREALVIPAQPLPERIQTASLLFAAPSAALFPSPLPPRNALSEFEVSDVAV
jgi:hypothetical protein